VKQLLEPKLVPGFSLLDWKDRILSWLPFILVTDSLQEFNLDHEEHIVEDEEGLAGTQETLEDQHRRASPYIVRKLKAPSSQDPDPVGSIIFYPACLT
jgi:hypothetical protein